MNCRSPDVATRCLAKNDVMKAILIVAVFLGVVACTSSDNEEMTELRQRLAELEQQLADATLTTLKTATASTTSTTSTALPPTTNPAATNTMYGSIRLAGAALTPETRAQFPDVNSSIEILGGDENSGTRMRSLSLKAAG